MNASAAPFADCCPVIMAKNKTKKDDQMLPKREHDLFRSVFKVCESCECVCVCVFLCWSPLLLQVLCNSLLCTCVVHCVCVVGALRCECECECECGCECCSTTNTNNTKRD